MLHYLLMRYQRVNLNSLLNVLIGKKTGQPSFAGAFLRNQMIIKNIIFFKLYNYFLDIVKLAIVRFYLGTDDVKIKESLKEYIKNTVFDSVLDHIDSSLASGVPLVYGQ